MLIDCFLFYNELDMLLYRLSVLDKHVDAFILVESAHTFIGNPKPLFYAENREKFAAFSEKIIHVVVEDSPYTGANCNISNGDQWKNLPSVLVRIDDWEAIIVFHE
jgi:beta-1,4-mannosyl-glycoprotein beta-1,4-N-acetylglucosaminyltransferase